MLDTRHLPPLPALRAFEAVARLGSVVRAADELSVTHSAISHQLRSLEDYLGVALFIRQGRRLTLTEDGRTYGFQVRRALAEVADATRQFLSAPRANELRLSVVPSFGAQWLAPRLPSLLAAMPDFAVSVHASLDVVDLRQQRLDVGIRMGAGPWQDLQAERLMDDRYVLVAAPHFNCGDLPQTPQQIVAAPRVLASESWQRWLQAVGLPPQNLSGPTLNDSNLMLAVVRSGHAVGMTRHSLVHQDLRAGTLVRLSPVQPSYPDPYWLVWPQRSEAHDKIQRLRDWLHREIANYQRDAQALIGPQAD